MPPFPLPTNDPQKILSDYLSTFKVYLETDHLPASQRFPPGPNLFHVPSTSKAAAGLPASTWALSAFSTHTQSESAKYGSH